MDETSEAIATAIRAGQRVAVATVAAARGSTPRRTGAKMVVHEDGSFCGTIGGGCGEAEVWSEALEVARGGGARVVIVDLTNPLDGEDKICGGLMEVFVEPIDARPTVDNAGGAC